MGSSDFYLNFFSVIAFLLILVVPVQWLMNFYFGLSGGVLSSIGLSLLASWAYLWFHQFGRAMASTGNIHSGNGELFILFGSAFLISMALSALTNFGVYHLVQYYKTGILHKLAFFGWLFVAVGGPLLYIGTKELKSWWAVTHHKRYFTPVAFTVYSYPDLPVIIDELRFINTSNGKESTIHLHRHDRQTWEGKEADGRSLWKAFSKKIDIPKGADKFIMSWYSLVEDQYYSDEFPFPYDRFPMRKYPAGSNEMEPLELRIKPEGKVDLFGSYRKLLFYYKDVATKPIIERIKQDPHLQEKIKKEYPEVIEEIEKEENKEVEEPEEITLDEYTSEEIEYARVWLQVVENEDPNVLYVQHIPKGTHINEYEHEESVTYPEDVIMIFTDYTAGGMVVYSGNGDGTINLYDVPSHWQGGSTTLDNEDIKEYTNKIINETETINIEPRSDKKIEQIIKVLEYAG